MANQLSAPTPARARLGELQKDHPPVYALNSIGSDRPRALAGVLQEKFPARLLELLGKDQLAVGEIGEFTPDTRTLNPAPDNFVVGVNSGLMDFYYAVGRAVHGLVRMYSNSQTPDNAPALGMQDVTTLVADTLKDWRSHCQPGLLESLFGNAKQEERIRYATFGLSETVHGLTESLVTSSELFIVAHELGHVAMDSGACASIHNDDESDADAWGLTMYLPCAEKRFRRRLSLAAMAFAVRITASLTTVGAKFSKAYKPPAERLQLLLDQVRKDSPSEQYYDESATILVNYLDLMDHVDARITGKNPSYPLAEWQGRVRLIAVLEAVATEMKPPREFEIMCRLTAANLPAESMSRIGQTLKDYYIGEATAEPYQGKELRDAMGQTLTRLISQFPGWLESPRAGDRAS